MRKVFFPPTSYHFASVPSARTVTAFPLFSSNSENHGFRFYCSPYSSRSNTTTAVLSSADNHLVDPTSKDAISEAIGGGPSSQPNLNVSYDSVAHPSSMAVAGVTSSLSTATSLASASQSTASSPAAPVSSVSTSSASSSMGSSASSSSSFSLDTKSSGDVLFDTVWRELVAQRGTNKMVFPKEIVFLMGAPASGKGTNTQFILQARGITALPLTISKLLASRDDLKDIMNLGGMVDDHTVTHLLLSTLLDPSYSDGVLVDGYPRTPIQVDIVKRLRDRMLELRAESPRSFPRPVFRMTVLYVDENVSVDRQIRRGQNSEAVRNMMADSGQELEDGPRATDTDIAKARHRYQIFREHLPTLVSLRKEFPFHMISGNGSQEVVRNRILRQFAYQSSLELDESTFDMVNSFPTLKQVTANARHNLVKRLDEYSILKPQLFAQVMESLKTEFLPRIQQNAISGRLSVRSENPLFLSADAVNMALDVLSERGFRATYESRLERVPERVDPNTFQVINTFVPRGTFEIRFEHVSIRYTDDSWVDLEDQR